jgi:hypothetical protein
MKFKVDSALMNVFETDWYKKIKSEISPGENMSVPGKLASASWAIQSE